MKRFALPTLLLCVCVVACPAAEVIRGPYVQLATPGSMTVVWRTSHAIEPVLRYGAAPQALDQQASGDAIVLRVSADVAAASDEPFGATPLLFDEPRAHAGERGMWDHEPSTPAGTRQFEAKATGLTPATRYYYAIYDGDTLLAGGDSEHYFTTSPEPSTPADLRVWVVGDSGTGGADQRAVFRAMQQFAAKTERRADAFVHVGDMAYGDGADVEFQRNFFDMYQLTLRNTVCWPSMGNHEGHTSRGISQFGPYYDAYVVPTHAEAGGVASGTEAYYSFDIGRAHFVCLDSHDLDRTPNGAMAQWLSADLDEADADWLIAFWHHPPYTKGSHDSDRERQLIEMRTYLMPLLESGGVDVVLSGHSHIYERSMLIDGAYATPTVAEGVVVDDGDGRPDGDGPYRKSAGLQPNNGTIAIVAGHGGAGVSRKGTMPIMREIIVENGSLVLDFEGDTLNGTMINKRGETRDVFQLVKRGTVDNQPIANPWQPEHDPSAITEEVIAWTENEIGAAPPHWAIITGSAEQMLIENRPGTPYHQAAVKAEGEPFLAVYDKFDDRVSELQAWFEPSGDSPTPAGLVLGYEGPDDYYAFLLDPATRRALFVRVESGERTVLAEREVELSFGRPVKVELEPVQRLIEVQLNDEVEYTVNFDSALPAGRVGVVSDGGSFNVAGVTIERAR